jgi:hypothetical protein
MSPLVRIHTDVRTSITQGTQARRDRVVLRVHGVSGTPPEKLLDYPSELIECFSGDDGAGFYRRRPVTPDGPDGNLPGDVPRRTEAFCWGGLTSGPATRALWLLFLPFIFVNVAHWMMPPTTAKRWAAWSFRLLRVLGLSFSVTLLLTLISVLVDIVGWQCAGMAQCADRLGPFTILADWPPGVRLAVTAAPIMAVAAVLRLMQRESPRIGTPPPAAAAAEPSLSPLSQPHFWNGDRSVDRLRDCHLTVWFAVPAATVLAASISRTDRPATTMTVLLVLNGLFILVAVGLTCCDRVTARGGTGLRGDMTDQPAKWSRWMWQSSLAVGVVSLVWVLMNGPRIAAAGLPGPLPFLAIVIELVIGVQVLLLVLLTLTTWMSKRSSGEWRSGYRPTLCGLTAPCVAVLAWCFSGEASVAVSFWVARLLGQPVESAEAADAFIRSRAQRLHAAAQDVVALAGTGPHGGGANLSPKTLGDLVAGAHGVAPLQLPDADFIASAANLFVLALVALFALVVGRRTYRRGKAPKALQEVSGDYPDMLAPTKDGAVLVQAMAPPTPEQHEAMKLMRTTRVRAIASARAWSKLADSAGTIVVVAVGIAVVTLLVTAGLAVALPRHGQLDLASWFGDRRMWTFFLAMGQAMAAFVAAVGVGLAYRAFRSRETRRRVAVLWDVATFWPLAAHPLGPPSYGERAVPDLRDQASQLAKKSRVVISAHSQGTVLAAAALLMDAGTAQHPGRTWPPGSLALLTFGSPLRRLYARNFPAYFGFPCLDELRDRLSNPPILGRRWHNLWALTDPIGGEIFPDDDAGGVADKRDEDVVDERLLDTQGLLPVEGEGRYPQICGHSGFWTRPEYLSSVDELASRLAAPAGIPVSPVIPGQLEANIPEPLDIAELIPMRLPGPGE